MSADLESLDIALPEADCLLLVPPLAHLSWPAIGVHQLQACAREAGLEVAVLYVNQLYAALVGPVRYASLCNAPVHWLLGERLFARAAWGAPPLGYQVEGFLAEVAAAAEIPPRAGYTDHLTHSSGAPGGAALQEGGPVLDREELLRCEAQSVALAESLSARIAAARYPVVGATSTFDQTAAGLSILRRVKRRHPRGVTVMGGANCEGPMAVGVRSLAVEIDVVCSGESEAVFVELLRACLDGAPPSAPLLAGAAHPDLDALPRLRYGEYFEQVHPDLDQVPLWVLFETSRGCWWADRSQCTFCGLARSGKGFRRKSADRVVEHLSGILAESPTRRVCMTDNTMPADYHDTLVPRLTAELPGVHLFYEQRADLSLDQVAALHRAGCRSIQPGIEALDSSLLRLVRKGLPARRNLALLRYARAVGMVLRWNLLWGFPGDDAEAYRRSAALIPRLHHLPPPQALAHLHLDRFSPYLERPEEFGITELRPLWTYAEVFPPWADLDQLAYHFEGSYPCGSHDHEEVIGHLREEVGRWQARWDQGPPALELRRPAPGAYILVDTRGSGPGSVLHLGEVQARAVLVGGPLAAVPAAPWALRNDFAVELDGWCVPLATAPLALITELEGAGS